MLQLLRRTAVESPSQEAPWEVRRRSEVHGAPGAPMVPHGAPGAPMAPHETRYCQPFTGKREFYFLNARPQKPDTVNRSLVSANSTFEVPWCFVFRCLRCPGALFLGV